MPTVNALPPGPKTLMPGGLLWPVLKDPLKALLDTGNRFGRIAYFRLGMDRAYLINDPDLAQEVLVTQNRKFHKGSGLDRVRLILGEGLLTSEDDFHQRQRRLIQPAFHRQRIAGYAGIMADYAAKARDRWKAGETLEVEEEMARLTLSITGKTLFNADVEAEAPQVGEALAEIRKYFTLALLPFAAFFEKLPTPKNRRFWAARDRLDEIVYRIIREHRSQADSGDFLSMLLSARDSEGDGKGMDDKQVRDEAITIFLAGHETITNTLTWTWYLLSQHPEAEAKFHAEVDQVLSGRLPAMEDYPKLSYTKMVLSESMRLYPPGWVLGRQAVEDCEIGGYRIPKGSTVLVSEYVLHHNPLYFPDPEKFNPERFTPEAVAARPKMAYIPFGAGPHICIGEGFAWMEGVLVMAVLAQKWKFRLSPGHPVVPGPQVTLRPKFGMRMILEARKDRP